MLRNIKVAVDYNCVPIEEINETYTPLKLRIFKKKKFALTT
jgi:hypothetical protein